MNGMIGCWFHKARLILTGNGSSGHFASCGKCGLERSLAKRLGQERALIKAPEGLSARIIQKIDRQEEEVEPFEHTWTFPWIKLSGAVAFVAAAAIFLVQLNRKPEHNEARNLALEMSETIEVELPKVSSEQIQRLSAKLDQPLQQELQSVISDTRQAIQFVASNFIPEER